MDLPIKNYKMLIVVPIALMVISVAILSMHYMQTGDWFNRSFELTGGTLITVETKQVPEIDMVENALSAYKVSVRTLTGFGGGKLLIQAEASADSEAIIAALASAGIDTSVSSVQMIGPALSESFWIQAQIAMAVAFILMGVVVFVLFRDLVPSGYVMLCAFFDIVVTMALMQVFGIELSLASLGGLIMLLDYSVDTDILLTTRCLRGTGTFGERWRSSVKTGLTMSATALGAMLALYISGLSPVISEIAAVLILGLCADVILTWVQNSILLKVHMERKGLL